MMQLSKYSYEYPFQDCDNFLNSQVPVCKDFFRFCSGFGKKGFYKLLNFVENYDTENRPESPCHKYFRKEGLYAILCVETTVTTIQQYRP